MFTLFAFAFAFFYLYEICLPLKFKPVLLNLIPEQNAAFHTLINQLKKYLGIYKDFSLTKGNGCVPAFTPSAMQLYGGID